MSTSTSTAPPSALGECVVCGKETSTRCSSCATGGVDWMFFCSRDHQKLIWSVHKRVCGAPFRWPLLKKREREESTELSSKSMQSSSGNTNWLDTFKDLGARAPGASENLFKIATDALGGEGTFDLADEGLQCLHRAGLFGVRSHSGVYFGKGPTRQELQKLIAADPFGFHATVQRRYIPWLEHFLEAEWYSDLQHRIVIAIAVLISFQRSMPTNDVEVALESGRTLTYAVNKISDLTLTTIELSDPQEAKVIRSDFIPGLLLQSGLEISEEKA